MALINVISKLIFVITSFPFFQQVSQNRRSQSHGDNGKSGNKSRPPVSKDDSMVSYKSGRKYQATRPGAKSTAVRAKVSKKMSKSTGHLNDLQYEEQENLRLNASPKIFPTARSRLPVLEKKYLRQISSAPEDPKTLCESPLTSRTYKKTEVEFSRQISSAPGGQVSDFVDDQVTSVVGHISPRDLVTSTPKELDLCSSRRSNTQVTPQNKFLMGVSQGVGAENTLSSIHSEASVTEIMKTGVNRPKTQGMRRDHTFISHSSNLSSAVETADENKGENERKTNRSISSRGSTIRFKDRKQAGSKVVGLKKDKASDGRIIQRTMYRPRNQVTKGESTKGEQVNAANKKQSTLPVNRGKIGTDPALVKETNTDDDVNYESLPSRENTFVPDVADDVEIGEEAKDVVKRESESVMEVADDQRKIDSKQKVWVSPASETGKVKSKCSSPFTIIPPIRSSLATETLETSSNHASMTNNDSLASTNLADSLLTENESGKEEDNINTQNVKGTVKENGKINSKAGTSVKRKPSQKKVLPYAKVNNSKHVPQKVKKADSFLKIEGKPPTGPRPKSVRYGLDYTHRSKQSAEEDKLSKSVEANTIGRIGNVW